MPETAHREIEEGNSPDPQSTSNQPSQGGSNFGDSSGPLFSIYSKAAEEEDKKMVERWQKDADGILIFTGLFSAAVGALLAVTVQDLRPNSQDISAFYLGNIYKVLTDPNVTRPSIPSPAANPPRFTPPRYAVLVNSLWSLSLVMSLSCALLATSLHQWASRYLRLAHPARCSPEKRARMRAYFANGVEKMHVPWAVEALPTLLHFSLFLFFGGLVIFQFNIDQEVFISVVWWIRLFSVVYGIITLLPIIRHDSPYNSPLSTPAWFLCTSIHHMTFKILAFITSGSFWNAQIWERFDDLRDRYQGWMLGGVEKAAEETASERSSEVDIQILDWTISALGADDSLKSFFEAIPGFVNSKLVKHLESDFTEELLQKFRDASGGFLGRTWSSNSVNDSEKLHRFEITMNAMNLIPCSDVSFSLILHDILFDHQDEVPQTVEMGQTLAPWCSSKDLSVARYARAAIVRILRSVQERDDSWVKLASRVFGLPERDLWDNVALGGDNVLLAIFIHVTGQYLYSEYSEHVVLEEFSKLDIRNTLPRLQHDFCMLWNKISQEARKPGSYSRPVAILRWIRHLYITLHQGTEAAPTAFSASTPVYNDTLWKPSSYPFCNLASHRPDPINSHEVHFPTPLGNSPDALSPSPTNASSTFPQQAKQTNIVAGLPSPTNPTITSEIGETFLRPNVTPPTNPVHPSSRPTGASSTAVVVALHDITSTATLSHPLEGSEQLDTDIVVSSAEPGTSQILSTASTQAPTPTLTPISTSLLNIPSESYDTGVASVSNSSHFANPNSHAVPFPAQPDDSATPIIRPSSPSDPTTIIGIRNTSQAFTTIPIPPQINSGGSRLTSSSTQPAVSHHDSHDSDQSQPIPMELFRHQTQSSLLLPLPPDIVLDASECEDRQHGLN